MAFPVLPSSSSALSYPRPSSFIRPHIQSPRTRVSILCSASLPLHLRLRLRPKLLPLPLAFSSAGDNGNDGDKGNDNIGGGGGGGGGGLGDDGVDWSDGNRGGALLVLREMGRKLESLPDDLAAAVEVGSLTGDMVKRFAEMEGSPLLSWLMQSQGLRDRLLADNLFLAKLATECGVGIASKTAEEYERRKENFFKEMDTVVPYVAMSMVTDFMLVYVPAPTLSLQPPLGTSARIIASLSSNYPDITSQIAFGVRSYLLVERIVKLVRISPKLFAVTTGASLVDTTVTSALIIDTVVKEPDDRVEEIPVVSNLDRVEDKEWTSFFGVGAEITAGLIPTHSMVDGRFPEIPCPAVIARASTVLSRCTFGRSRKHGTA